MPGANRTAIGVTGNQGAVDLSHFENLPGVSEAIRVTKPYKLITLDLRPERTVVDLGDGPTPLPAVEIVPQNGVYDYAARYTAGLTTWHVPARLDPEIADHVALTAVAAHVALGLRDLSRVDLIVEPDGTAYVLEVNVAPGMTETSLLPMAVSAAELDFGKVLAGLVSQAASRS